jgi:hypothetical protein
MIWTVGLVSMGAIGATLTPEEQKLVDRAIEIIPSCWSQEIAECVNETNTSYPNCSELNAIYNKDKPAVYAAIKAHVDAMPYCSPTPPAKPGISPAVAFGAGVVLTMLVATVIL